MTINSRAVNNFIDYTSQRANKAFELYKNEKDVLTRKHLLSLVYDRILSCKYIYTLSKDALYSDEDKRRWDSFTSRSMELIDDLMKKIREEEQKVALDEREMKLKNGKA